MRERYGPFADRLLAAYPAVGNTVTKTARDLARDSAFGWHTWSWARLQSRARQGQGFRLLLRSAPATNAGLARGRLRHPARRRRALRLREPGGLRRPMQTGTSRRPWRPTGRTSRSGGFRTGTACPRFLTYSDTKSPGDVPRANGSNGSSAERGMRWSAGPGLRVEADSGRRALTAARVAAGGAGDPACPRQVVGRPPHPHHSSLVSVVSCEL